MIDALRGGSDAYVSLERWLIARRPRVGYLTHARSWQPRDPSSVETTGCFNVDAVINAFHYSTLGLMLPYDAHLDVEGIFYAQYIMNLVTHAFFTSSDGRVGWDCVEVNLRMDRHVRTSKNYVRSHNWTIPNTHFKRALLAKEQWRLPNRTELTRTFCRLGDVCRPADINGIEPYVVDAQLIEDHLVSTHPLTQNLLVFIKRHAYFLSILRTRAFRENATDRMNRGVSTSAACPSKSH